MAVIIPVNIKTPELRPVILLLSIAILHPRIMGIAMVKAGPIVSKRGLFGLCFGAGGASISTFSVAITGRFLGERLNYTGAPCPLTSPGAHSSLGKGRSSSVRTFSSP